MYILIIICAFILWLGFIILLCGYEREKESEKNEEQKYIKKLLNEKEDKDE